MDILSLQSINSTTLRLEREETPAQAPSTSQINYSKSLVSVNTVSFA